MQETPAAEMEMPALKGKGLFNKPMPVPAVVVPAVTVPATVPSVSVSGGETLRMVAAAFSFSFCFCLSLLPRPAHPGPCNAVPGLIVWHSKPG